MSEFNLRDSIKDFLRVNPRSSARQIAKSIANEKTNINSILYAGKGVLFTKHDTSPPTWSLFANPQSPIVLPVTKFKIVKTSEPIHVDFQGGDWKVTIQIQELSRNDPVVSLERTGPNAALIKVSSAVINQEDQSGNHFPDAVLALASSALAWEIAIQQDAILEDKFDFHTALKDIYMSIGISNKESKVDRD